MSLMMLRRCCPEARMWRRKLECFGSTRPSRRSTRISEKPMIEFIGVRSSCDMLARNWLFSRLASWMRRFASANSRERCWSSSARRVSSLPCRLSSASSWRMRSRFSCRLLTATRKKYDAAKRKSMRAKASVNAASRKWICPMNASSERYATVLATLMVMIVRRPPTKAAAAGAAPLEPIEDGAADRGEGADRDGGGEFQRKDADGRADARGDEPRAVDDEMLPLEVEIEAENALARGVGGHWTHRDAPIVALSRAFRTTYESSSRPRSA